MLLNKKLSANCNLYLILDANVKTLDELFEIAKQSIEAGVNILQLRAKQLDDEQKTNFARKVIGLLNDQCHYVVNDQVHLAKELECSLHVGQDDVDYEVARKELGDQVMIGVSCQTLKHAQKAEEGGANYIGFGSIFKTQTKPERTPMDLSVLKSVVENTQVPLFAIGGINLDRIDQLKEQGVKRFAVCRSICEADDVYRQVKKFKQVIES
jgi:thiamine-phosphate pyrophosphorylase